MIVAMNQNGQSVDRNVEIRKLGTRELAEIASELDPDNWERLMDIIPETLYRNDFACDYSPTNPRKYTAKDIELVRNARTATLSGTLILFDEWGTSGRVRPTVRHLLYLLSKANLRKVAKYVAVNILGEDPPLPPATGPGAAIFMDLPETREFQQPIPSSNVNLDSSGKSTSNPKVVVSPDESESRDESSYQGVIPDLGQLIPKPKDSGSTSDSTLNKINTNLAIFLFEDLKKMTKDFAETPDNFLGSGGFGQVFVGRTPEGATVAVKKSKFINEIVKKQFMNEVEILSKYGHENLVSLLGYSCDGPSYCLVYELVLGGSLLDRLKAIENKLVCSERVNIALGTARAIEYLHSAEPPLIHRDIKSANILLDDQNKPKLCDFGLLRVLHNQNTTMTSVVYGTGNYMAPEAVKGYVSVKMDTYSFGAVLLELLTSLPPNDVEREFPDLVYHVKSKCKSDDIRPLLDESVGDWMSNGIDFGKELYCIAKKECLQMEMEDRATMVRVTELLTDLMQKCDL